MRMLHSLILFFSICFSIVASGEPIVVIGDSLSCGPFGKNLVQNLSAAGHSVTLYCAVSSAPRHWLTGSMPCKLDIARGIDCRCNVVKTASKQKDLCGGDGALPVLSTILGNHKGARVIIALGTNSLLSARVDSSYSIMADAAAKSNGKACTWIAPPHLNANQARGFSPARVNDLEKNLNTFYDSLAKSISSNCKIIDSREATAPGTLGNQTVDGVHRNNAGGKYWADAIQSQIQ